MNPEVTVISCVSYQVTEAGKKKVGKWKLELSAMRTNKKINNTKRIGKTNHAV